MKDNIISGSGTIISNRLFNKMKETLESNKQVILYVNNKSYSSLINFSTNSFG